MRRTAVLTAAIAVGCAVFAIPSIAQAQAPTDPLTFDSMTPADGASIVAGTAPTFEMSSSASYFGLFVEVSTQPTLGQDGTLAEDFEVGGAELGRSDANPSLYRGVDPNASYGWASKPGVYYWQAFSTFGRFDPGSGQWRVPAGPVQRITVTARPQSAAPAPRLGISEGYAIVRDGLKKKFGSRFTRGKKLKARYSRLSATTIRYSVSWVRDGAKYAGSVKVRETANDYSYWVNVNRR
jgi:hypothetical protein